ncbi:MAG: methyltransferase [Chloroflexota bacterium]
MFPTTDPSELFRRRDGLYATDMLITAIGELDFFNWLAQHPADRRTVCTGLDLAARPADVMLTLFSAMGLLDQQNGVFSLSTLAKEHLLGDSAWDLGPYFLSLKERPICKDILAVLRTGRPFGWANKPDEQAWAQAMEDEAFAQKFTAAMDSRGAYLAPKMAQALDCTSNRRLLDIAGASGVYACAVVQAHAHMRAAVLEKPPVDKAARRAVERRGLAQRVAVLAGDMFGDPLPSGYDLHLYSHVLHDWDEAAVQQLLRQSYAALPPGGRLAIHDAHLNAEKTGPLAVAEYSVLLMLSTEGKCYSVGEMQTMLAQAGFAEATCVPTVAARSLMIAQKPI